MRRYLKTLIMMPTALLTLVILAGCGRQESPTNPPGMGLHEAALQGNLEVVRQHIAAGSDLNVRDPMGGATPLITAATFGRMEVALALIEAGAELDSQNNDGSTALHTAAFLCHPEMVRLLLENGADRQVKNKAGATAFESVAGPFEDVKGVYDFLAKALGPLGLQLDYDQIKATRPQIAAMLH